MSATALSRAMAREPWSREYFEILREYVKNELASHQPLRSFNANCFANYFQSPSDPLRANGSGRWHGHNCWQRVPFQH